MQLTFILFWLGIAALWGSASYGVYADHRRAMQQAPAEPTSHYFFQRLEALQRRNLQLWGMMSLLLAVLATQSLMQVMTTPPVAHSETTPEASPATPPVVERSRGEVVAQEPVHTTPLPSPQQAAEAPKTAAPVPAPANGMPYSDITEFNEKDSKQQAMIDWLKQRYENWLITYYYLQKCGLADKTDFDIIRASLHRELNALQTDTAMAEDNILMAANGSYNELYASASCNDERMKATKVAYETWMAPLRTPSASNAGTTSAPTQAAPPTGR